MTLGQLACISLTSIPHIHQRPSERQLPVVTLKSVKSFRHLPPSSSQTPPHTHQHYSAPALTAASQSPPGSFVSPSGRRIVRNPCKKPRNGIRNLDGCKVPTETGSRTTVERELNKPNRKDSSPRDLSHRSGRKSSASWPKDVLLPGTDVL